MLFLSNFFKISQIHANHFHLSSFTCSTLIQLETVVLLVLSLHRCGYLIRLTAVVEFCMNAMATVSRQSKCVSMETTEGQF
jgi:hypothetical protein